jgi:hypothetical protein
MALGEPEGANHDGARSLEHVSEMPRIIAHAVKLLPLSINVARRESDGCLKVG